MTQKERLIELIIQSVDGCARHWAEIIADYLLDNGVIVINYDLLEGIYDYGVGVEQGERGIVEGEENDAERTIC